MRIIQFVLFAAIAVLGLPQLLCGATVRDQFMPWENTGNNSDLAVTSAQHLAQTFTAGVSGKLVQLDLIVMKSPGLTGTMTLSLRPTAGGIPDATNSLFEIEIDLATIPDSSTAGAFKPTTSFDVSQFDVNVLVDQKYAISLEREGPSTPTAWALWREGRPFGFYLRGEEYMRSSFDAPWTPAVSALGGDLTFATYVQVPEPSSVVCVAIGLIGLAAWGWRRKRAH
jgi:hypothetical protein